MNKLHIQKNHATMPRIGYLDQVDKETIVIFHYDDPYILGMRFRSDHKAKAFKAKIQPHGGFTIGRDYYHIQYIKYYEDTPQHLYIKKTTIPAMYREPLSQRVKSAIYKNQHLLLSPAELKQVLDGELNNKIDMSEAPILEMLAENTYQEKSITYESKQTELAPAHKPEEPQPKEEEVKILADVIPWDGGEVKPEWYPIEEIEEYIYVTLKVYKNAKYLPRETYDQLNQMERIDLSEPSNLIYE
jgi:hypothetical protein